jgi:hypothetical protein
MSGDDVDRELEEQKRRYAMTPEQRRDQAEDFERADRAAAARRSGRPFDPDDINAAKWSDDVSLTLVEQDPLSDESDERRPADDVDS